MAGESVFDLLGSLAFDLSAVQQIPAEMQAAVDQGTAKQSSIKVGLDDTMAQTDLRRLNAQVDLYVRDRKVGRVSIQTTLDTNMADDALKDLQARIERAKADLSVAADMSGAVAPTGTTAAGGGGGVDTGTLATTTGLYARQNMIRGGIGMASMVLGGATLRSTIQNALSGAMEDVRMEDSVRRVFGPVGDQMVAYTTDMSNATKFLDEQLMESVVNLGDAGDAWGITTDQVKRGLQAITDVAHTTGLPQFKDDINAVTQAIIAGAAGRGTGLKKLGINVSEDYMASIFTGKGGVPDWKKMTEAEKSAGRFNEMMKQLADIQGKAATDTQSAAYAHRAAVQKMDQAWDALGAKLMPLATKIMNFVASLPTWAIEGGAIGAGVVGTGLGTAMMFGLARGGLSGLGRGRGAAQTAANVAGVAGDAASVANASLISRIFGRGLSKAAPMAENTTAQVMGGVFRGSYAQMMERVSAGAMNATRGNLTYASSMGDVGIQAGRLRTTLANVSTKLGGLGGALSTVASLAGSAAAVATVFSMVFDKANKALTGPAGDAAASEIRAEIRMHDEQRIRTGQAWQPISDETRAQMVSDYKAGIWGTGTGLSDKDINALIDAAEAQQILSLQSRGQISPEMAAALAQQLQDAINERLRVANLTENPTAGAQQTIQIILQNASNTDLKVGTLDAYSSSPDAR